MPYNDSDQGGQSWRLEGFSRRRFLTTLATAAASSYLATGLGQACAQPTVASGGIIDVHHHVFPPSFLKATEFFPFGASRARMVDWTAQRSLAEMDAAGVATAVASITNPGIWFGNAEPAIRLARECNEYQAQLARDHPGRFGFFAAIPLPHTNGSLREIEYALEVLKADGIGLMTNYGDKWPGDEVFGEVFGELNRRKAVVYLHPTAPNCCRQLLPGLPDPLVEFPHDTTRAVVSLLYSGTFSRCRDIRFIFSHAGGTIPMLSGRLNETGDLFGINKKLPNGPEFELKRLHYEIANSAHRTAFAALTNLVPASQILFGTDYPFIPIPATAGGLANLGLPTSDLEAIRRGNAVVLFPRIRAG
jgi:6-methylsalicylate decarboxylase